MKDIIDDMLDRHRLESQILLDEYLRNVDILSKQQLHEISKLNNVVDNSQ